jgi:WD40 repeat protein
LTYFVSFCLLGLGVIGGSSSFSGKSGQGSGDYIVASQAKKPVINIWQWGKPQVQMQCRIQELTPSICVDTNGFYIFGGTKGGRIFCWEVSSGDLVMSWQAHYKAVTTMVMSSCGTFLVSGAEDGMIRTWDVPTLLTSPRGSGSKKNIPPFRYVYMHINMYIVL